MAALDVSISRGDLETNSQDLEQLLGRPATSLADVIGETHHHPHEAEGGLMATMTDNATRTAHLLALMKKGDDAFNARDFAAIDTVHHPDMVAHITGNAQPIYGSVAHAAAMQQMLRIFPDMHVYTPYPIQFGSGDWITVISRTTGTFRGQMALPNGKVIAPTGKAFDVEFGQTTKWDGDRLIIISAFWDAALQAKQIGLSR